MNNFCADIHNNLSIILTKTGVIVKPCCWYQEDIIPTDNIWDSKKLIEIRDNNKNNLLDPTGCKQCIYMEKANHDQSRRTGVNTYYKSTATDLNGPRGLEISIDYTCNLACVYCTPLVSTQWRNELSLDKKIFPIRLNEQSIVEILDKLDLSNLDNIHFYGGDPFFTKTHEVVLDYLDKRIGLKNLYIWYNTNGTLRVPEHIFDLWNKCKLIKIYFSIDDIGSRFEYIRYGAVWNEVSDNMLWYKEFSPVNVMFTLQPTISCLNLFYHRELLDWKAKHFDTNRLGDFTDLTRHNVFEKFTLDSVPPDLLDKCIANNKEDKWLINLSKSFTFNPESLANTIKEIKILDQRRKLDFSKVFPELSQYYNPQLI